MRHVTNTIHAPIHGLQNILKHEFSLYDLYNSLFEGVVADTDLLKRECFKLRYKIYCEEFKFEDADENPGGLECDEHDTHSAHALLRFRPTGEFVGTVRLILHPKGAPANVLPVHKLCNKHDIDIPALVPLDNFAEISRFCMLKDFRRTITDVLTVAGHSAKELETGVARIIPSMSMGLMNMIVVMSQQNGVKQWGAEMEPFLLRLLSKMGIHFEHVGPLIEFHGQRQVCHNGAALLLDRIAEEKPDVWDIITDKGRYRF